MAGQSSNKNPLGTSATCKNSRTESDAGHDLSGNPQLRKKSKTKSAGAELFNAVTQVFGITPSNPVLTCSEETPGECARESPVHEPEVIDLTGDDMGSAGELMSSHFGQIQTTISRKASLTSPTNVVSSTEYMDNGDPIFKCAYCAALFWYDERLGRHTNACSPAYSLCCVNGKVQLPRVEAPPPVLTDFLYGEEQVSKHFRQNIRSYNSMFSFTSLGGKIDVGLNNGTSPPTFRLHGQNYHLIGSLMPPDGSSPKFAQLYIYDTENEVSNRIMSVRELKEINSLHAEIVAKIKDMLDENNVLVKSFRMARERVLEQGHADLRLRLLGRRDGDARRYNLPAVSEVAALVVGDFDQAAADRDIIVETQTGQLKRINELNAAYLGLQYPLLFPYGEDGYREDIPYSDFKAATLKAGKTVSMREFFAYRLHERVSEASTILFARRLFQQFVVDAYTMIEAARLLYIRDHQKDLRCDMYKGLSNALERGETNASTQGKRVILPSSFTGGARYMVQNYQDAMAICKWAGYPDLFITFTCNPKWPEIERYLEPRGLRCEDRPDILCRVFKMKLDNLIDDLRKRHIFGKVIAVVYTIEFQKRGLPHAHILLFQSKEDKCLDPENIDRIISAELPDKASDPAYYAVVQEFMIHGPCGVARLNSPCMRDGRCGKYYPKQFVEATTTAEDGYPIYRRRDNGITVDKNGVLLDNRYVVPHNRALLLKYRAHINVEWCNQSRAIKYLFKYLNKGHDRATATFASRTTVAEEEPDEIKKYYDCRYISPCEAVWRILGFEIQYRYPPVERLGFHLQNEQNIIFEATNQIDVILERATLNESMFMAWFEANRLYPEARKLTYVEFPTKFVWNKQKKAWTPRNKQFKIGRIFYVPPGSGEMYYLRCLLNVVRGPTCFADIRRVNGVQYVTFKDACYALGMLEDDREYIDGIIEASAWASAHSLRNLFVTLLTSDSLSRPEAVWENCRSLLAEDILYKQRIAQKRPGLQLCADQIHNLCLGELEELLRKYGKSLRDYPGMPYPDQSIFVSAENSLICDELRFDRAELGRNLQEFVGKMNAEQRIVYDKVLDAVGSLRGGMFFVYGYGGTGKTFLWKTLSAALRSKGEIVLNVASSGIASLLLPGGRTAHSRFKIPLNPHENSTCEIHQGSPLAELIVRSRLIIWDEAPMMHRYCFEALDRTLRDIMSLPSPECATKPFGGKTIVFGGDFRQILPVIPRGSRQDIVHATINSSYLWNDCQVLRLTKNMRLSAVGSDADVVEVEQFSKWIAKLGDGKLGGPNDGHAPIDIPSDMLVEWSDDPIAAIVRSIFPPNTLDNGDVTYLQDRAILAPTLAVVGSVNDFMTALNTGAGRVYQSADTTCLADSSKELLQEVHTPEFLNSIRCSGIPTHELVLKVGAPIMLLRNIDLANGLCNGTRLIISRLGDHVLEAKIIAGPNAGQCVLIPRMSLTPADSRLPFKFRRRQFPITVSYAMTINKSQGQSLSQVGVLLQKPVFTHGQLYVAVSRVRSRSGLKILIPGKNESDRASTTNVVFKEVFRNL